MDLMATARIFARISTWFVLIPTFIFLFRFFRLNREQKILGILIVISAFTELVSFSIAMRESGNLYLLHIYTIIQFTLLTLIYRSTLRKLFLPIFSSAIIVLFVCVAILAAAYIDGVTFFNSVARVVESLLVLTYVLGFFVLTLRELRVRYLEKEPLFWISTALLIYFSGNLFIFILYNYSLRHDISALVWGIIIHSVLAVMKNILYCIALWVQNNTNK